ncbi:MAG TPA: DUF1801 domain-containing protein [Candidatus Limnocylindrales bacterium]|nr:DUF1801 domain-containing protein [Candidatus Limnocylindrales bacterium]
MSDAIPPDAFLEGYPPGIRAAANRLRRVVRRAAPNAVERVRLGWRLIGYDIPVGRRTAYFAFVAPEPEHVHLGFEHGILLDDPDGLLQGAHLRLRKVRFVTYRAGEPIDDAPLARFAADAARMAAMSRDERLAVAMHREASGG